MARGNAFLTPDWARATQTDEVRPMIVAACRKGGELAGVLPLVLDPSRRPRALRYAGSSLGDRFGIAARPEDEGPVATAAMGALQAETGSPLVILHRVERSSEWPALMASAASGRFVLVEQSRSETPYVSLEGLDWEGYLAQRSQKFRQRIGRGLERALDRAGVAHGVRETRVPATLEADLDTLFSLHDLRHAEAGDSSIASPQVRDQLRDFARAAFGHGWLRLRILDLDGAPAAAYLGWRLGSRYCVYQSGFDPAYAEWSPGALLLNDTIRSAIGEQAGEVDLLLGGEPFKWRFAPERRRIHTLYLVGAMRPARLLASSEAAARRRGRRLLDRPRVGRALRAIAGRLPGA